MSRLRRVAWLLTSALLVAGCAPVGPDYQRPTVELPADWQPQAPWRLGKPADGIPRGQWWRVFADERLDQLEQQAMTRNNSLAIAMARLDQSRALASSAMASVFPELRVNSGYNRLRTSADRPLTAYQTPTYSTIQNDFSLNINARYEADVFGRVRRTIEAADATAQQSAADLENLKLLISVDVANNYITLGSLDNEIDVVTRSLALQRKALEYVKARYDAGSASGLDLAQQKAQIDATSTQLELLVNQRTRVEHALATLVGTPAPVFSLAPRPLALKPYYPSTGVPSDLLERRPDIASAERAMAAANAQIGVASAAFYPSFNLGPSYGLDSRSFSTLFDIPSLLWAFGVQASQLVFDGGRAKAAERFAQSGYQASLAAYKQVVLVAMQEVEDGLGTLVVLERAQTQASAAVASSTRLLELANDRYAGGIASYLDVIAAQQAQLASERIRTQILGQQVLASVFLVKALGGGWQAGASEQAPVATR
jgi:NodT family efflux transporter outer membrane factor (OMF) lipoprotein